MHHRSQAERAIRTFKDHFLAILAGVDAAFPPYLWDLLLLQTELTLNLLCQSTINPWISAWEFFQGQFDFNKTPLGPVGCRVLIHAKSATRQSWDFCAKNGFNILKSLAQPWTPTSDSSLSMLTPKARSSLTQLNSATPTFPSYPLLQRTESFTDYK